MKQALNKELDQILANNTNKKEINVLLENYAFASESFNFSVIKKGLLHLKNKTVKRNKNQKMDD
jgi:hypothetical protein